MSNKNNIVVPGYNLTLGELRRRQAIMLADPAFARDGLVLRAHLDGLYGA